jgi:hypothetical protein
VDEQATEPRLEVVRVADRSNVQPRGEQGVLDGGPEELVERGRRELGERVAFAVPCSDDEIVLHRGDDHFVTVR